MFWPNLNELAPTGTLLLDDKIRPATDLIRNGYSSLVTRVTQNAREMLVNDVLYTSDNQGNFSKEILYDVYFTPNVPHCLNVYGARVLRDRLQQEDPDDEIGFNYTGIQ